MLAAVDYGISSHPVLSAMVCLRCAAAHPVADYDSGCPRCLDEGFPANVAPRYERAGTGICLPYCDRRSLGEGATPLVEAPELADHIGVGRLSLKLEWCNPTGSHKDRMSAQLVARAVACGAGGIIASSSGNAGVSLAAYAARCGIAAEIVTTPALPPPYRAALSRYGARITEEADSLARWAYAAGRVKEGAFAATNYRLPAVGTNAFGIEGYKTIAAELADGGPPDLVVVPTARGDLLSGLQLGFAEIGAGPRLLAVEPFPRLSRVLEGDDYRLLFPGTTAQYSIAGPTVTYQAVHALRSSHGMAVAVDDTEAIEAAAQLGRLGFHAELSAAAGLAGLRKVAAGGGWRGRHAVVLLTGAGFRDPAAERSPPASSIDQRGP